MEGKAMLAAQEARACSGESLPVGEPVTLVIEEERFFGWVASASPAHSLACVAIEFTRGSHKGPGTHSGGKYPAAQRLFTRASGITQGEGARSSVAARLTEVERLAHKRVCGSALIAHRPARGPMRVVPDNSYLLKSLTFTLTIVTLDVAD